MRDLTLLNGRVRIDQKKLKFVMVSAVAVPISQVILFVCHEIIELSAVMSNVIAVTIGCIPSYMLNRYWVWGKRGKNHFWREVFPFWAMAALGLVLSSIFVWWVSKRTDTTLVIQATNLSAFGLLYVAKYLVLDRLLFAVADELAPVPNPEEEDVPQPMPLA